MVWPKFDSDHVMVTASQMAKLESQILSGGLPVEALMEKVGLAMAKWLTQQPDLLDQGVFFLIGPGHNGGDGLVVARELHLAGIDVSIWCPFPINKTLTSQHYSYAKWLGIKCFKEAPSVSTKALWVEALFGIGQCRPLAKSIAQLLLDREQNQPGRLVSLDVPAGICADTGKTFDSGAAVAAFTLTAGLVKQGLVQDVSKSNVGKLVRVDLGLSEKILKSLPRTQPIRICSSDLLTISWPYLPAASSKYQRGRALVMAGSDLYRGAALLALQGALGSGVGSIKAVLPEPVANTLWQVAPEIVLEGSFRRKENGEIDIGSLLAQLDLLRIDSFLMGPGLKLSEEIWKELLYKAKDFERLLVLDAEALNVLSGLPESWKWLKKRLGPTWITPHFSEFRRLFPEFNDLCPLEAAKQASQSSGAGILLKGANSIISLPTGSNWQLTETSPFVARTGLGDLLAGFAVGVGAMGVAADNAFSSEYLAVAAFVHSEAAKRTKEGSSPSVVAESLRTLVRTIQEGCVAIDT